MTSLQPLLKKNGVLEYLTSWLQETPKYTTFRINELQQGNYIEHVSKILAEQSKFLDNAKIPNIYILKPNCLVIEKWSDEVDIQTSGKEIIVDASCGAAVLRGSHVYVPGVMGMPCDIKIGDNVNVYADLEGKCLKGLKVPFYGKKTLVGKGKLKLLRSDIFEKKQNSGIAVEILLPASRLPVLNETAFPKGQVTLQNLPSIVCGWVVDARPNEVILDMCAAPGNKTTHLAEMSNNRAMIIAIDKTTSKVEKIQAKCVERGISCVKCVVYDSTKCLKNFDHLNNESDVSICNGNLNGPPFSSETFDKILLDVPCSGLGQRPLLQNKMSLKELQSYRNLQRKLLMMAVPLLKRGGRLVYSTCSVSEDENEAMVAWALAKHSDIDLVPAEPLLGGPGWSDCGLTEQQRLMVQRFGPESDTLRIPENIYRDTIGFFIASFRKKD